MTAPGTHVPESWAWRLTWYPRLLLLAIGAAFVVVVLAGDGSSTTGGRVGGDYPAFYSAGTLVADGRIDDLYDTAAQAEIQDDLLGGEDGYLGFAYAPHVAAAYALLAELPYRTSYVVHTMLMAAALLAALQLLRPVLRVVDEWFALVALVTIGSYPMFMAIGGGQNTALTFLCLAAIWRALDEDREVAAGIAVTALMFRPQYALPVLGLLLLGRHRRAIATAAAGTATLWLVNAALFGASWVTRWLDEVTPFLDATADANAPNAISLLGFQRALFGVDSPVALVIGGGASAAVIGVLAWVWWQKELDLGARMALTATGVVLLSPHALFYDAGVIALTLLLLVDRRVIGWPAVAFVWSAALLHLTKGALGATPFALVVLAVFVVALRRLSAPADPTAAERPLATVS